MKGEIKVGDMVEHKFTKKKYVVIKINEIKSILGGIGNLLTGKEVGDFLVQDEKFNKGWLPKHIVKKVSK